MILPFKMEEPKTIIKSGFKISISLRQVLEEINPLEHFFGFDKSFLLSINFLKKCDSYLSLSLK